MIPCKEKCIHQNDGECCMSTTYQNTQLIDKNQSSGCLFGKQSNPDADSPPPKTARIVSFY
ncbi:MAG TPA: hypothetical protein DCY74_06035, partial [Clostridiales bacterium]|nr:hypothetical protein [Clostridiales bacterium]